jgi:hypothetical protein
VAADESNGERTQSFIALTKDTAVSHHKIIIRIGSGGVGDVYRKVTLKFPSQKNF